jgi:hypothetical protein
LGFDHVEADADAGSLMQATLAPGVRRLVVVEQDEAETTEAPAAVSEQGEDPTAAAQAAVLVFDETAGTFQAQDDTVPPAALASPVLERTAFETEEDTETPPAVVESSARGRDDGDSAVPAAPADHGEAAMQAAPGQGSLIAWDRTFTAPPETRGQHRGTPALAQVPEFVTLPAKSAAAAPGAAAPDAHQPEVVWPMPLSAPLAASPDWGRERTREAQRD